MRDNNDPERLGRCRLEIPAVLGTGQANWSEWAAPCFPYGTVDPIAARVNVPPSKSLHVPPAVLNLIHRAPRDKTMALRAAGII